MSLPISSIRLLLHLQDNRKWKCRKPKEVKHSKAVAVVNQNTVLDRVETLIQGADTAVETVAQAAVRPILPVVVKNHGVTVMQVIVEAAVHLLVAVPNVEAVLLIKVAALRIRKDLNSVSNIEKRIIQ